MRTTGTALGASPAARLLQSLRPKSRSADEKKAVLTKHKKSAKASQKKTGKKTVALDARTGDAIDEESAAWSDPRVIFVSATVAGQGASSVGAFLEARFPQMRWIRSDGECALINQGRPSRHLGVD